MQGVGLVDDEQDEQDEFYIVAFQCSTLSPFSSA
jgi:hypothetical protein